MPLPNSLSSRTDFRQKSFCLVPPRIAHDLILLRVMDAKSAPESDFANAVGSTTVWRKLEAKLDRVDLENRDASLITKKRSTLLSSVFYG
ncbi:MAG: hypothetical protein HN965_10285 [Anaerolineae bacterium]|nr:hypothetical protein [Anaerolineae bacterium]MBT7016646.1 hypothetical protein [Anaerolineae bacterium]